MTKRLTKRQKRLATRMLMMLRSRMADDLHLDTIFIRALMAKLT